MLGTHTKKHRGGKQKLIAVIITILEIAGHRKIQDLNIMELTARAVIIQVTKKAVIIKILGQVKLVTAKEYTDNVTSLTDEGMLVTIKYVCFITL